MLPPLIVRVDATTAMGGGHLVRCLALAQAWKDAGGNAAFVGRYEGEFPSLLAAAGMPITHVARPHPDLSDVCLTNDRIGAATGAERPFLVIDGYHFDLGYQRSLRAASHAWILRVDDSEGVPQFEADILLNQNVHAVAIPYDCDPNVVVLAGTRYALLRKEFHAPAPGRVIPPAATRVLAMFGGSDPAGVSAMVLRAFDQLADAGLRLDLVVGPGNLRSDELERLASELGERVRLHCHPQSIAALMRQADLAVAAAGSTVWELAALGVPMLLTATAPNQMPISRELERRGAAVNLGPVQELMTTALAERIREIAANEDQRALLASRARRLVDGCGAERVVTVCRGLSRPGPFEWSIRHVSAEDVLQVWRIANDPTVRANSFNTQPIAVTDHMCWFSCQLVEPGVRWWAADLAGLVVAHARYTRVAHDWAEVHFSVAAPFRGRGIAGNLLSRTFVQACDQFGVRLVRGFSLAHNAASARAFEQARYSRVATTKRDGRECVTFERLIQ